MEKNKYVLLLIIMGLFFLEVTGQKRYSAGFFYSMPVGKYKEQKAEAGGYALPGYGVMLQSQVRGISWPEWLSANLRINYQENEVDNEQLQVDFDEIFTSAFGNAIDVVVVTGNYNPLHITAGPVFSKGIGQKLTLELNTGLGVMFPNIDPIQIDIYDDQASLIASETVVYKGNPNLTFRTSLGLNIELSEAFNILVFGDYGYANEKLEADLGSSEMDQTNQVISYINTGIGLSYKFK